MEKETAMTLSPAAQAVLDAAMNTPVEQPYEFDIAAALRAAAEQLGYTIFDYENNEHPGVVRVSRLLAIATELEGFN